MKTQAVWILGSFALALLAVGCGSHKDDQPSGNKTPDPVPDLAAIDQSIAAGQQPVFASGIPTQTPDSRPKAASPDWTTPSEALAPIPDPGLLMPPPFDPSAPLSAPPGLPQPAGVPSFGAAPAFGAAPQVPVMSRSPFPVQYVPESAVYSIGFVPTALLADPDVDDFLDVYRSTPQGATLPFQDMRERYGLSHEQFDSVLMLFPEVVADWPFGADGETEPAAKPMIVARLNETVTLQVREPILEMFQDRYGLTRLIDVRGVPVQVADDGTALAFTFDRCLLVAPQEILTEMMRRRSAPTPLAALIAEGGDDEVNYAFRLTDEESRRQAARMLPEPVSLLASALQECETLVVSASIYGTCLTLRAEMEDAAAARSLEAQIEQIRHDFRRMVEDQSELTTVFDVPENQLPRLSSLITRTATDTTTSVDGSVVRVELSDDGMYRTNWFEIAKLDLADDVTPEHNVAAVPTESEPPTPRPSTVTDSQRSLVTRFEEGAIAMEVDISPWNGYSLAFSPDGDWIVAGKLDDKLMLIDVEAGELLGPFEGHDASVDAVLFTADGTQVVSASREEILVWDFDPEFGFLQEVQRMAGHSALETRLVPADDEQHVLSAARDKTVRYWSLSDGTEVHRFDGFENHPVAVAPGRERRSAYATDGQYLYTLDLSRGRTTRKQPLAGLGYGRLSAAAFSPDSRFLAGTNRSELHVWGLPRMAATPAFGRGGGYTSLCYAPDGESLVSGTPAGLTIWDPAARRLVRTLETGRVVNDHLAVSPDGKLAATTGDRFVRVWRLDGEVEGE